MGNNIILYLMNQKDYFVLENLIKNNQCQQSRGTVSMILSR